VLAQRTQHGEAGADGVVRFPVEHGENLVSAHVLQEPIAGDDRHLHGAEEAQHQLARLRNGHPFQHPRIAPDIGDEHGHLALHPMASSDSTEVGDVEDAQHVR
jgi:hypothetical protein